MANRSLRQLEALALVDYRFYLGTIADFSPNGRDLTWTAGREPRFRRCIGQVVGLDFGGTGAAGTVLTSPAFEIDGEFAWEILFIMRSRGEANFGHLLAHETGTTKRIYVGGANTLYYACNTAVILAGYNYGQVYHLIASRDGADVGTQYRDGVAGATGDTGGNDSTSVLAIGNSPGLGLARAFDGVIFSVRTFDDAIDPDEAALLYEHSRIQLWPGAPKRSGIVSPVL